MFFFPKSVLIHRIWLVILYKIYENRKNLILGENFTSNNQFLRFQILSFGTDSLEQTVLTRPQGNKKFSCSTQLSLKFFPAHKY